VYLLPRRHLVERLVGYINELTSMQDRNVFVESMIIRSPPGSGKTSLLLLYERALRQHGYDTRYMVFDPDDVHQAVDVRFPWMIRQPSASPILIIMLDDCQRTYDPSFSAF